MALPKKLQGKKHEPTAKNKELVENLVLIGLAQKLIADVIGVSLDTLKKHYNQELTTSVNLRNAALAAKCYQQAMAGDTALLIFLAKTKLRWSDKSEDTGNFTLPRIQVEILPKSKVTNDTDDNSKKDK